MTTNDLTANPTVERWEILHPDVVSMPPYGYIHVRGIYPDGSNWVFIILDLHLLYKGNFDEAVEAAKMILQQAQYSQPVTVILEKE